MQSFVARREVAAACRYGRSLRALRSDDLHCSANCVPIAFVADEIQSEPMVLCVSFVAQNVDWAAVLRDDCIKPTVIINVPDCHASTCPGFMKCGTRVTRNVNECFSGIACQQHRLAIMQLRIVQFN